MAAKVLGIDFGTDSIKIYRKGEGIIYDQKTVIATKNKKTVIAIGNEAFEMNGKVPEYIAVEYPIKSGVIASFDKVLSLLNCIFLDLTKEYGKLKGAHVYLAIPADITEVEKKAFYDLVDSTFIRPKKIRMVDKPVVDAIGSGVDINNSQGVMVVDIGADTTEISVLSLGGIVLTKLLNVGGNNFDESIMATVRRKYNLLIGDKTAEVCKKKVATLNDSVKSIDVYGRDVVTGLPREREVTSDLIKPAIVEQLDVIVDNVKMILERTPPEISADIYENGIYLVGGSAKIPGLADYVSQSVKLKVHLPSDAIDAVINGLAEIMENDKYINNIVEI